jgi:hypothetical protein
MEGAQADVQSLQYDFEPEGDYRVGPFMQQKNRARSPHRMIIPIVAQLKEVIAKTQTAI